MTRVRPQQYADEQEHKYRSHAVYLYIEYMREVVSEFFNLFSYYYFILKHMKMKHVKKNRKIFFLFISSFNSIFFSVLFVFIITIIFI